MPSNAFAQFRSTPNAIAKGRNRSNISGVRATRSSLSDSTRLRNSSNPSAPSLARAPSTVLAGMKKPKMRTMSAEATAAIHAASPNPKTTHRATPPPSASMANTKYFSTTRSGRFR